MGAYVVTFDRDAAADLVAIRDYIADVRDRAFADAFVDRIIAYCEGLAETPFRGALRDHISPGLRIVGWRKTVTVAFEVSEEARTVAILGVFYRGRDVLSALRARK